MTIRDKIAEIIGYVIKEHCRDSSNMNANVIADRICALIQPRIDGLKKERKDAQEIAKAYIGLLSDKDDWINPNEPIMRKCPECGGSGCSNFNSDDKCSQESCKRVECDDDKDCPTCKGKGEVPEMYEVECNLTRFCREGKIHLRDGRKVNCPKCHGTGKIKRPKTLGDLIEEVKR